jgi:hypothetical protein
MDASAAIGGLLTAAGLQACRPTGLRVALSKSGAIIRPGGRQNQYAKLTVADLCAGDWWIEPIPEQSTDPVNVPD